MAKIKEITKAQPEPIKGVWWFKIVLDNGQEAFYSNTMEAPYVAGDEIPRYEIKEQSGRGGVKKILTVLPPLEEKKIEVTADFGEKRNVILSARARACIDLVPVAVEMAEKSAGKAKTDAIYKGLVKMVWKQLDDI